MCELRPRPDDVAAVVQRAMQQLSLPPSGVAGRRFARLYQHVDDPCWLLYMAEWESPEAFMAYRRVAPGPGTLDQFTVPPACRVYQRLTLFERPLMPSTVARADIVAGPADTHRERRACVVAYHHASMRDRSHLVLLSTHEATDAATDEPSDTPPSLLPLTGWDAASGGPSAEDAREADLIRQVEATGGTVQRFVGRPILENLADQPCT